MKRWLYRIFVTLCLIGFTAAVWIAGPLLSFADSTPLDPVWVRLAIILPVWAIVLTVALVGWIKRRRAAKALEAAIIPPMPVGDGIVLAEKMTEALNVLKKSSGRSAYLYDLPWYIIIGPPGAGKTTALLNSGVKFPLAEKSGGAVAGFGGTRHCDWWFSEEAVLIDTAGRYTTQDSDAEADRESWMAFLKLLKTNRAKQPINGVIVAISVEEVMRGTPESLNHHAETIRARLMEIHDQLKVEFPVYVVFTKADLIAGFMEYFGSFSASRRQKVWGATFQTANRKEQTVDRFGKEYDALVNRLSEEVTDRLNEEPDGVSRIAIFGFPGQVAMLKDKLNGLLREIFESSRYKINASLRGFYFSSGTQEGTPFDQVLGAMERSFGTSAIAAPGAAMSGKGKSFFLHDLLKKVIFAEAGWVSFDRRAVRRDAALRYGGFGLITLATFLMLSLWGWSFWQNRQLIRTAQASLAEYELAAQKELTATEVNDDDVLQIAGLLQSIRDMPLGYGDAQEDRSFAERFGLSQRGRLNSAATASYRQALERMLRSRMILRLEQQLQDYMTAGDTLAVYEALKVYKLLGGVAPKSDDPLVISWAREDWRANLYPGPQFTEARAELEAHLTAMLELDDAQNPTFELNGPLIDNAERMIARMNVADQAYLLIKGTTEYAGVETFNVALRSGPDVDLVFETVDGREIEELTIPGIYTYQGFHEFFLPQLAEVAQKLSDEQWVMGDYAETAAIDEEIGRLGPQLLDRYTNDFITAWDEVLGNVKLRPMSADQPAYRSLAAASAPRTSPIFLLFEAVMQETQLTREFSEEAAAAESGTAGAAGGIASAVGDQVAARIRNRTSGLARIGIDVAMSKSQRRAGGAFAGSSGEQLLPGAAIEAHFREYSDLFEGDQGQRRIDLLLASMAKMQEILMIAQTNATVASAQMPGQLGGLKAVASRLPDPLMRMVNEAVGDFEGDAASTSIVQLNNDLSTQVTQACAQIVENRYPFARNSEREVPMAEFARLFAPNGAMDVFFNQNLAAHADMSGKDWVWKTDTPLGAKLSAATLKQFQRAADIRDAFFPLGGAMPNIEMRVGQNSMHDRIKKAEFEINGLTIETRQVGNTPVLINWPGSASAGSAKISLTPEMRGRENDMAEIGAWALMRMIDKGKPKLSGKTIQTSYVIGGRNIGYDFTIESALNPFFLRALSEFKCPNGL